MSLYLSAKRSICNSFVTRPQSHWANRALYGFGRIAHWVTFKKYTPGITTEAFRLHQATSPGDKIVVKNDGFYRNGEKIAGNKFIAKRIEINGLPTRFQCTEKDAPEDIARYCRLNFAPSTPKIKFSRRGFLRFTRNFFIGLPAFAFINFFSFMLTLFLRNIFFQFKTEKTSLANYYGWFSKHTGLGLIKGSVRYRMPVDLVKKIALKEKYLVVVPEMVTFESISKYPYQYEAEDIIWDNQLLRAKAAEFIDDQRLPILQADLKIDKAADSAFGKFPQKGDTIETIITATRPVIVGTAAAAASASTNAISRRSFLALLLGGAIACGQPIIDPWRIYSSTDCWQWSVVFRNALIAAKILHLAEYVQRTTGKKLSFLLLMGNTHTGIMENLRKGMDYNLRILEKFIKSISPALFLSRYGKLWKDGYLLDKTNSIGLGKFTKFCPDQLKKLELEQ